MDEARRDEEAEAEEIRARRAQRRRERRMIEEAALTAANDATRQEAARETARRAAEPEEPEAEEAPPAAAGALARAGAHAPTLRAGPAAFPPDLARAAREARMQEIRGELRRRRRLRALGMLLRFMIFVLIPTGAVAWYYYEKATDMYVSESAMIFKSGTSTAPGGIFGSFLGGAGSIQDSVALQEYILSRDILERLDRDHGWIAHFQDERIDEFHRLAADATVDEAHDYYAGGLIRPGKVKVSYDSAEGIIRLEVVGVTPEAAKRFSEAIISYGEELVNALNERSRNDGVEMARANVAAAREDLRDAQRKVAEVQEQLSIFSVESEAGALQTRIVTLEAEIDELLAEIARLETITSNPIDSRFTPLRTNLEVKTRQLRDLRVRLTGDGSAGGDRSMAQLSSELELARVDQATTQMMYSSALSTLETAIASAAEQSLYLETVVRPAAPQNASKPDRLANVALVFLVLFATYIIGLLTISLIREQAAI